MGAIHSLTDAIQTTRRNTGIVIPVYLPASVDQPLGRTLLRDTVESCLCQLERPQSLCLSVDGEMNGLSAARGLARELGVLVCAMPDNRGKLHAVRGGMQHLLDDPSLEYLAVVDQDGDHFANELVNFVRAARHWQAGGGEVLVLGERSSRHRPLGFLRGELEELADRIFLDALAYDAAVSGRPLALEACTPFGEFPDFHSGYKLFTRRTAAAVFLDEPRVCGATVDAYYRHGCEAVMVVEAIMAGARLALVRRSTLNEQPQSTFGMLDRARLVADKIIWPCKRLGVPGPFVDQWLRNHAARLQLGTLVPAGRDEVGQIVASVREAFGMPACPADADPGGPVFV